MPRRRTLAALAAALLGAGCAGFWSVADTDGSFVDAVRTYTKMVRWGEYERAAAFVAPDKRERFTEITRDLEGYRFTDYELGPVRYGEAGAHARVHVTYRYYDEATLVEEVIEEEQTWRSDGFESWHVEPAFDGLPGAQPEPAATAQPAAGEVSG